MKGKKRIEELLEQVTPIFVDHPYEHLSLQGVADARGLSLWALRYHFGNVERLFRAVATRLIDHISRRPAYRPEPGARVMDVVAGYAAFLADLFEDETYRNLLYLVLRNGRGHAWLERAYERTVVARFEASLETLVLDAGRAHGAPVLLADGSARRLYKRLETELALSALLPSGASLVERSEAIRAAACQAFAASYVFDWQVPAAA